MFAQPRISVHSHPTDCIRPGMMSSFFRYRTTFTTRVKIDDRSRKRSAGASTLLAIITLLSTLGAIAAWIGNRDNASRAERYATDASCHGSSMPGLRADGACSLDSATVTGRYIHTYKGSHTYWLTVRTSRGIVDSIVPKGTAQRSFWEAASPGASLVAQLFNEKNGGRPHVTLVALDGREMPTEWNPGFQAHNTAFGVWFLSIVAVLSGLMLVWQRMHQPPAGDTSVSG